MNNKAAGLKRKATIFEVFNYTGMVLVMIITLYPFWYCLIGSLNQGFDYLKGGVFFIPRVFSLENYAIVLREKVLLASYKITILRTVIGTATHVFITALFAYGFSRRYLIGKNFYAKFGLITMYFSGGLIPQYILYNQLGLLDTFWVYIIPGMISFYHVIITQAFFKTIPEELNESAVMDGAGEYRIFFSIIIPVSKPVLAAIALFTSVGHWNSFFDSMVFTTSTSLQTVQVYLMRIIRSIEHAAAMAREASDLMPGLQRANTETIKLATMMVATVPILVAYPFFQKYFVKGIMLGSVKG